ncbi:hypothetical protein Csa_020822 [Cucumis sativus]|uniref:Uncharacterized protein n=1 Tax=Cucumis sativus TaxID=3659 RepID=A0A0A0KBG9_CUCSA|nr:hypothetical protein Csa_020822 [Cucumis sativus]
MTVRKSYVLRLFISLKCMTANVVDRNNGRIVATASTVEHSIQGSLECGRQGQGRGIHADINKEIEKKGFKNGTKIWAIVNSLKNNRVKRILDNNVDEPSRLSSQ